MRIAITGGTGLVGRFIVEAALEEGHEVLLLGPARPFEGYFSGRVAWQEWRLGETPKLAGCDGLVHAALAHLPGRYRGGEGRDAAGFTTLNLDGSVTLFEAARAAGVDHALFLSSRAVFDGYPPGTTLAPDLAPRPTTLYGRVKAEAEVRLSALASADFVVTSLRATGVFGVAGPGRRHKWATLFDDFLAGRPIGPRAGSEVHGADLARAVLLLFARRAGGAWHVSDILLDRHDLLARVASLTGCTHPLPPRATGPAPSLLDCTKTEALGWRGGGMARLEAELPRLIAAR